MENECGVVWGVGISESDGDAIWRCNLDAIGGPSQNRNN